jgi:hypothetical protein
MLIFEAQCTLGMRVWAWSRVYTWTNATWTNASVSVYAVHGIFVGVDRCMHGDK